MKILHLTAWYPSSQRSKTALWIKRHVKALASVGCLNKVYHLEVAKEPFDIVLGKCEIEGNIRFKFSSSLLPWRVLELVAFLLALFVIFKERKTKYDIVNFHIAYPNLVYYHWLKRWFKTPIVITEHWSAYHDNFGMQSPEKLPRIQRIFRQKIPVIGVSHSLIKDIEIFSDTNFENFVVPNVVDTEVFFPVEKLRSNVPRFFMVSQWKSPKNPFSVIETFADYLEYRPNAVLVIGGYGPQLDEMKELVEKLAIGSNVSFLGVMSSQEVAEQMNRSTAFVHISNYETFSVVCAEAYTCGIPVLASKVGGIPEFINENRGVLIEGGGVKVEHFLKLESFSIDSKSTSRFSIKKVGEAYLKALRQILQDDSRNY